MQEFDAKSGKKSLKDFKLEIGFIFLKGHFEFLLNRYSSGVELEDLLGDHCSSGGQRYDRLSRGRNSTDEEKGWP